jgi:methionine synthase I (cobalamin-dependent)
VEAVARGYVEAGSRVILTNTFGANRFRLAEGGLEGDLARINERGVAISRRAADGRALVFASMGPSGKLQCTGEVKARDLRLAFEEQAMVLADTGADAIVVETMMDLEEAILAVEAAQATGLPVIACMVFGSGRDKDRTMTGVTPEQAAGALAASGVAAVGANCGQGIADFVNICRRLCAASDQPVWIKANAGLPELAGGQPVYPTTPEAFASCIPAVLDAGADFIGGCCGTDPGFIKAAGSTLRVHLSQKGHS